MPPAPREVSRDELASIPHLRTLRLGEAPFSGLRDELLGLEALSLPTCGLLTVLYHPLPWLGFPVSCKQGLGKAPLVSFCS